MELTHFSDIQKFMNSKAEDFDRSYDVVIMEYDYNKNTFAELNTFLKSSVMYKYLLK